MWLSAAQKQGALFAMIVHGSYEELWEKVSWPVHKAPAILGGGTQSHHNPNHLPILAPDLHSSLLEYAAHDSRVKRVQNINLKIPLDA